MAFYTYPPNQLKYITRVSISALVIFIGIEIYLTNKGPIIPSTAGIFSIRETDNVSCALRFNLYCNSLQL